MAPSSTQPRLVRAARGEALDRPPVWMMRQAGRYMPEYQAIRGQTTFLGLCKTPDLAVEVSLQPYRAFGMDGVIMFSDILVVPEAMGMELQFLESHGPHFPQPLRSRADIEKLAIPDPNATMPFVMEILRRLRSELSGDPEATLIGFAGAPWTLASYMLEGGSSKNYTHIKTLMYEDPQLLHLLLGKLAESVTLYLNAQIEAGAQVVQLFDSWGGILPAEHYREFVLPYHQQILNGLKREQAPAILYVNGSRGILPLVAEAEPDVISVDHLTSLADARALVGSRFALQGNLDPVALFAKPEALRPLTEDILVQGGRKGFIFNLGHGILPQTPVEHVRLVVDTVKQGAPVL